MALTSFQGIERLLACAVLVALLGCARPPTTRIPPQTARTIAASQGNFFKIHSWQTGPSGNAASPSGKCLDYGTSPSGNGATVFLNDCDKAHEIQVVEIGDRTDAQGNVFRHEVLLYAGNAVIGLDIPITSAPPGGSSGPQAPATEYHLSLQAPFTSRQCSFLPCDRAKQVFRLDGDSIILEGTPAAYGHFGQPTPCVNTSTTLPPYCADPSPQLVIQVQQARGANGSPLVAAVRNLSDNEFWDFVPLPGSPAYPTSGFVSQVGSATSSPAPITTNWQLWNAFCQSPQAAPDTAPTQPCATANPDIGWGSVIVISGDDANECKSDPGVGSCLDISLYPPIPVIAGVTVRGNRRGTLFGPQIYGAFPYPRAGVCRGSCVFEVQGDYARVTGLRIRGESRSTDSIPYPTDGVWIDYVGRYTGPVGDGPQVPLFPLDTVTELIALIDHNDMSDWMNAAIVVESPFSVNSTKSTRCTYEGYVDSKSDPQHTYQCDPATMRTVPYSPQLVAQNPKLTPVTVANDPGTLANVRVTRNFLHHNERDGGGYGVDNGGGRLLIDGNTFSWNRHDITGSGEPHSEYRASNNLVLSGAPTAYKKPFVERLQDFDMHGTDNVDSWPWRGLYFGGAGGFFVEISENTFLGGDGHDYALRGFPIKNSSYHDNVSRRKDTDAVKFIHCNPIGTAGCINDLHDLPFAIDIFPNNQFGQTSQSPPDPTARLAVGDFDGDRSDDLFMATGAAWFYSPAGQREWRFLNRAPNTIDQLLFGDFDGDGRTDVVFLYNAQLQVSWGGISGWEILNPHPCTKTTPATCPSSVADLAVGDFDGNGRPDIFWADGHTWWVSFSGNTQFVEVQTSTFRTKDLRFGDFNQDTTTDVFAAEGGNWAVSFSPRSNPGALFSGWNKLQSALTATVDSLVVADFGADLIADVGRVCSEPVSVDGRTIQTLGWQISKGGRASWSQCFLFSTTTTAQFIPVNGGVGHFNGGNGSDVLLWDYTNTQGAAQLWVAPNGTGTPRLLSSQDMH
jgi:hypothetical protein